ncbi:hypothetical protein [Sorangium sp. So ce854]|uniref:hypothetical protein n=1 Tax=Sorangium sp. So ce854 TaxID=3133322 RepID=UPI003F634964
MLAASLAVLACSGSTAGPGPSPSSSSGGGGAGAASSSGADAGAGAAAEGGGGSGGDPGDAGGEVKCSAGQMESNCLISCTREGEVVFRAYCGKPVGTRPGEPAALECRCTEGPREGDTFSMLDCNEPTEAVVRECG